MSEVQSPPAEATGLSQLQRVTCTFTAPSKTFEDIKRGNRSWWLPFIITVVIGTFLWGAVGKEVTWQGVYENNQRNMPAFAKRFQERMMENMPPEQRVAAEKKQEQVGAIGQKITWALAPLGLLVLQLIAAAVLFGTINFGFGGTARFGSVFAVVLYSELVKWPIKLFLGAIALYAGALPDAFNPGNPAGTNLAYYLSKQDTSPALYALSGFVDILSIWSLILMSIGLAIVAGKNRSAGYFAVFGWWFLIMLVFVGFSTAIG